MLFFWNPCQRWQPISLFAISLAFFYSSGTSWIPTMAGLKMRANTHTSWQRCSCSSGASWKSWRGMAETSPSPNQWDFFFPTGEESDYTCFSDAIPLQLDTLPLDEHTMPSPTALFGDAEAWHHRFRVQDWLDNSHHVNHIYIYNIYIYIFIIYIYVYSVVRW